ncbi:MAG: methyltransferase domain-containing protein [Patescibacteria group bacterium]|nr:methyltransferase domain-containing protein [Patescibacteria group bacterium]MDE2116633.1 methyltransferase domain-containing protein [Patescibacteria group bacterium]
MFSDPQHNIEQFGLSDGAIVADLGAGSGFYAIAAAKAVAPRGKVYAVDVKRDLLERLKREAVREHIHNIEILAGDLEKLGGSKIRESSCDVCIASNILFMIEDKKSFFLEARRILKGGGRLFLIDWSASFSQMGPHPDHVVYKDAARELCRQAGFEFEREVNAGSHHYGIIFRKK